MGDMHMIPFGGASGYAKVLRTRVAQNLAGLGDSETRLGSMRAGGVGPRSPWNYGDSALN